jgi:plasmid stabilization system protein ParE
MPEIGGEQRQSRLDLDAGAIPLEQRAHREGVAQAVQRWAAARRPRFEARAIDELNERVADVAVDQPRAGRGDEHGVADRRRLVTIT